VGAIGVVVGEGGKPASLPGQHGRPGGDTIVKLLSEAGEVQREIRVKGGPGGRSAASYLPEGVEELSAEDFNNGFRITTLMVADAAKLEGGTLSIERGGWTFLELAKIPSDFIFNVIITIRGEDLTSRNKGLFLSIDDPNGLEVSCIAITLGADGPVGRGLHSVVQIGAQLDFGGTWNIRIRSGGRMLAVYPIEVIPG
jgi:hypothetical protein